jgi:hypothetical protein
MPTSVLTCPHPLDSDSTLVRPNTTYLTACIMTVSSLLYEAILTDTVTTKRCGRFCFKSLIGPPLFEHADWNQPQGYLLQACRAVQDPSSRRQGVTVHYQSDHGTDNRLQLVDDLVATAGLRRQDFNVVCHVTQWASVGYPLTRFAVPVRDFQGPCRVALPPRAPQVGRTAVSVSDECGRRHVRRVDAHQCPL